MSAVDVCKVDGKTVSVYRDSVLGEFRVVVDFSVDDLWFIVFESGDWVVEDLGCGLPLTFNLLGQFGFVAGDGSDDSVSNFFDDDFFDDLLDEYRFKRFVIWSVCCFLLFCVLVDGLKSSS